MRKSAIHKNRQISHSMVKHGWSIEKGEYVSVEAVANQPNQPRHWQINLIYTLADQPYINTGISAKFETNHLLNRSA